MIIDLQLNEEVQESLARRIAKKLESTFHKVSSSASDEIMDVKSIAMYLGVSESCIYKKVSFNEIPFFKVGKHVRFRKTKIDAWIESNSVKAVPVERSR